jgi:mRNA-degrading endonuclease YafQ of YafQ-DinJ toxin-antitoxin module
MDQLTGNISLKRLFRSTPTIPFVPLIEHCPHCAVGLQVWKTRKSTVATLAIGTFRAHETIFHCPQCGRRYASGELRKLKPYRCRYGYDVMVYAGKAMFLRCRNEGEIQLELADKRVSISKREVSFLANKFIMYLSMAHKQSQHRIRQMLSLNGGYILHLDATCEGESPHLMCGLDGITEIVLENEKMSSEKAETIIPFLKKIQKAYGDPLAMVHDMGKGIIRAVEKVFPDTPDFICHYHFLAAVGKNLLNTENDILRKRLSKHGIQGKLRMRARELKRKVEKSRELVPFLLKCLEQKSLEGCAVDLMPAVVTYALVLWALAGKKQGNGYGFPFDRPYLSFYGRLKALHPMLTKLNAVRLSGKNKNNKPYLTIIRDLIDTLDDATLRKAADQMAQKAYVFDKLRKAMRIALPTGTQGINDRGSNEKMSTIAQRVDKFCHWVEGDEALSAQQEYKNMIAQIKEYWKKLFCDPITVRTPGGIIQIQPQRTNNILEQFFRSWKRIYRKKSGMNALEKIMKAMPANTPLVKNLNDPQYMRILLDGKESLEERFAEIDARLIRKELAKLSVNSDKVLPRIKKLIRQTDFPGQLVAIFTA